MADDTTIHLHDPIDEARTTGAAGPARANRGRASGDGVSSTRSASFAAPTIDRADADAVVDILADRLCALIDLALTLKHVHWNVVGPNFIAVHEMLDPQVAAAQAMVDEVAERISTMGGSPSGLPGAIVAARSWDDYEIGRASANAHLAALDLVYTGVITSHRAAVTALGELDVVSQEIVLGQTKTLEQNQWFCRAHLEDAAGGLSHAGSTTEYQAAVKATNRERAARPASR